MNTVVPFKPRTDEDDQTLVQTEQERQELLYEIAAVSSEQHGVKAPKKVIPAHFWKKMFG